jgi:hypothetical protein
MSAVCLYCHGPVPPPSPKAHGKPRLFCRDAHRAMWHLTKQREAVEAVLEIVAELRDETSRGLARLSAAEKHLAVLNRKGRRKPLSIDNDRR